MNIYRYIPSPDIAAYCEKIGHVFNPLEMAVIVAMSDKTIKEKHAAWQKITEYPDMPIRGNKFFKARESLHDYLRELIAYKEKQIEVFYAPADNVACKYEVKWVNNKEWSGGGHGVYSSVDKAWAAWKSEYGGSKHIAKVWIQKEQLDSKNDNYYTAIMNTGGDLLYITLCGTSPNDRPDDLDSIFIHLPVPFEKGDLVTTEDGTPCVLESIPHWNNVWLKYEDYVSGKIGSGYDMMGSYYFIAKHEDSRLFRDRGRAHDLWQMRFFTDELTGRDRFLKSLSQYIKTEDKCGNIDGLIAMFLKYKAEDEFMNIKKLDEWYLDPALRRDSLDDMDQCTILIDDWQMQCCGEPFKIDDIINWLAEKWNKNDWSCDIDVGPIDYYYEHHSSEWKKLFKITGKVKQIQTLYRKFEPDPKDPTGRSRIRTSWKSHLAESADGWDENIGEYRLNGYVVILENVKIAPANKTEVTFK